MDAQEERIHDVEEWQFEASFIINDIKDCVKDINISTNIPTTDTSIFLNLTTLEKNNYCVELTAAGFRIVGNKYDDATNPSEDYFETPYALLDRISPLYRKSFSEALSTKLLALSQATEETSHNTMDISE